MELQSTFKNISTRALTLTNVDVPTQKALQGFFARFTEHADLYALVVSQVIGMSQPQHSARDEYAVYIPPFELRKDWNKIDYFHHFSNELETVLKQFENWQN